jgi:hypothetical protein
MMAQNHDETFRNEKVAVVEGSIQPGAVEVPINYPSVIVYTQGSRRGEVVFRPQSGEAVKNGTSEMRYVRIDLLGHGAPGTAPWGTTGLSPHYKLLFENQYARAYDIRIPAGTNEPQHTHKDRVVVCLSGAELRHLFPDGRTEVSTLRTGEVAWRRGSTHIGQNIGKTDLWVIAIEPK